MVDKERDLGLVVASPVKTIIQCMTDYIVTVACTLCPATLYILCTILVGAPLNCRYGKGEGKGKQNV